MTLVLVIITGLWLLSAVVLLALCRGAARGDAVVRHHFEHERAIHWGRLDC